jgi:hypothetical protein
LGRGPNKAEREAAFQKLQSKWGAKNLEENLERDEEERQERKQIRQEEDGPGCTTAPVLYSPECAEQVFCEVHIREPV